MREHGTRFVSLSLGVAHSVPQMLQSASELPRISLKVDPFTRFLGGDWLSHRNWRAMDPTNDVVVPDAQEMHSESGESGESSTGESGESLESSESESYPQDRQSGESSESENYPPMFKLLVQETYWAIAPDGVTMEDMFIAWSAVKARKELRSSAAGGTPAAVEEDETTKRQKSLASLYDLYMSHMKFGVKLSFDKVRDWPVERQTYEFSKRIREAPMMSSRFTRGRDPEPFVPPAEENSHAVTVIFDYLDKKMKDERRGKVTKDDWKFLRSMDHFNARDMAYEPMTWTYLYGLWAHSMNATDDAADCTA